MQSISTAVAFERLAHNSQEDVDSICAFNDSIRLTTSVLR
jgi:hypothetical protein